MKNRLLTLKFGIGVIIVAIAMAIVLPALADEAKGKLSASSQYVVENAILTGLPAGALFPFIDTTPNSIRSTHIALTDATATCSPGAAPPTNLVVLVGEAGGVLTSVMTAATNTGIGSTTQCVFHVTVTPGADGVPERITDVVVVNAGAGALTALNTVTVSAEVR